MYKSNCERCDTCKKCRRSWITSIRCLFILIFIIIAYVLSSDAKADCRRQSVKKQFDIQQGYPHGRKGYVVDHICALAQGGKDSTINMQYQTISNGKIKDRVENTPYGRRKWCNPTNSTPTRQVYNCK